jgi:arabinogalactan endo-1,4-beta-galactosidase
MSQPPRGVRPIESFTGVGAGAGPVPNRGRPLVTAVAVRVPVFVINLDRAKHRLAEFAEKMARTNTPFRRWRATAGDELDPARFGVGPLDDGIYVTGFREWSRNEAACGVSHIRLLQHIVRERIAWAVVLEDDAVLQRELPETLERWGLPGDAEIVLLNDRATVGALDHCSSAFCYGRVTGGAGTEGYLISIAGAKKLLTALYPLRDPLDFQMYSHFRSVQDADTSPFYWKLPQNPSAREVLLEAYRLVPAVVAHDDSASTIGGQRHPRARYYCKVLLGLEFGDLDSYATFASVPRPPDTRASVCSEFRAVDVSHLDESLSYFTAAASTPSAPMAILSEHGVNCVRISIWVDSKGTMNLNRALHLGRLAKRSGLDIYLALHYSDHWADPTHQAKPATWSRLSFDLLCAQVYKYTKSVIDSMVAQGTAPAIVQIGNEITNGFLWAEPEQSPEHGGRLFACAEDQGHSSYDVQWSVFATLIGQAVSAVRCATASLQQQSRIMLQIDKGAWPEVAAWWFDKARAHGIEFDMIGLSFYYLWHCATLDELARLSCLSATFPDKGIMLAETSYPYRRAAGIVMKSSPNDPPFTRMGQATYLAEVLKAIRKLRNGSGVCWWGAFFLNDRYGPCEDLFRAQALFDARGVAVPALSAFRS